jgi:Kef-type K+ transport system membrane component KefB
MVEVDVTLLILLVILSLGLIIPELFKRFKLPLITVLILLGAFLGPNGLKYVGATETIEFFGFLGLTFLMLMAGIETNISKVKQFKKKVFLMALLNGLIPFGVGFLITRYFGYPLITSLLVGIVFISSSVAIIVPTLKSVRLFNKNEGQLILASVLIADIVSLIVLGFIFQRISPVTKLPLLLYYVILFISIILLFIYIPKISRFAMRKFSEDLGYERQLRLVLVISIALLAYFSILGVHPILAAFLAGLMLSGIIRKDKSGIINSKIHTLGYGIFVPVFFFIVGMEMDISLFKHFNITNILMISLIFGLISSKFISGYIAGRIVKLSKRNSLVFGSISIVQLTTTLAVTFAAASLDLLDNILVTSIILISIISVLLGPLLVSYIAKKR